MLVFLDETFRTNERTGVKFGALTGVAIPEDLFSVFQRDFYDVCRPYYGNVLGHGSDVHGSSLLTNATLKIVSNGGYTAHWSMAEDLVNYGRRFGIKVFGVVCFKSDFQSFECANVEQLDITFKYLFERIDLFMRSRYPTRFAKLIFDDRGRQTNERNAKAITRFFLKSTIGSSYDTIIKTPFYSIAKSYNYGLQYADLVTTIIGKKFAGDVRINPLWRNIHSMLNNETIGGRKQSSLKLMKEKR